jgi:lipoprotein-releasing system permease protein
MTSRFLFSARAPEGARAEKRTSYTHQVNLELDLAIRFLRRRSGVLLRGTALAAFAGIALAVTALVVTVALMTGYSHAIASALQKGNAHMVGFSLGAMTPNEAAESAHRLAAADGVNRATPVTYLSGLLDDPAEPTSPLPVTLKAVGNPPTYTGLDEWPADRGLVAVMGGRLAEQLGFEAGDRASVRLPPKGGSWILPTLDFEVVGTFSLAFAEFDEQWITVPLDEVLRVLPGTGVAGIEIELDDPLAVERARDRLQSLEPRLLFTDWREMNRSLFAALRWQTLSLFVVLSLVVAVASFQVSSALVVLAIDKQRSTGMLQALGATPARIRRILVLDGLMLGGFGVAAGIVIGCAVSWIMTATRAIRFPPGLARVYLVDSIPLLPTPLAVTAIAGVCMLLVLGASVWPAWTTSRQDPLAALRAV